MAEGIYILAQPLRVSSVLADARTRLDDCCGHSRQAVDGWLQLLREAKMPFENASRSIAGKSVSRKLADYLYAT